MVAIVPMPCITPIIVRSRAANAYSKILQRQRWKRRARGVKESFASWRLVRTNPEPVHYRIGAHTPVHAQVQDRHRDLTGRPLPFQRNHGCPTAGMPDQHEPSDHTPRLEQAPRNTSRTPSPRSADRSCKLVRPLPGVALRAIPACRDYGADHHHQTVRSTVGKKQVPSRCGLPHA